MPEMKGHDPVLSMCSLAVLDCFCRTISIFIIISSDINVRTTQDTLSITQSDER